MGKNGFIVDFISTDSLLSVFYSVFNFVAFSGKYHGKCLPILYAYLNGSRQLEHPQRKHCIKPNDYSNNPDEPLCKVSASVVKAFNFLEAIFFPTFSQLL